MHDLSFIEACYERVPDEAAWGAALAERLSPLLPDASAVLAASYELRADEGVRYLEIAGDARFVEGGYAIHARSVMRVLNASSARNLLIRHSYGVRAPSVAPLSALPAPHRDVMRTQLPWRGGDFLGLFAPLDDTRGYQLCPGGPSLGMPSPRRKAQLVRLCEHVTAGYWLRQLRAQQSAPAELTPDAVFAPDGSLLHKVPALGDPGLRERLVDAVRGMDSARCRRRKHSPEEASVLWQGLVDGQYALVESFERDGRRLILAVRCRSVPRALTAREKAVARSAAQGRANKEIAAELGIAPATVAVHLASALRKLQCPHRRVLGRWLNSVRR